MVRAV
jgi:DNA-binding LacI/PurR family transcriptional regulator